MTLPDPKTLQEVPKWTIRNDEWVQVTFALARSQKGLSDRPAIVRRETEKMELSK